MGEGILMLPQADIDRLGAACHMNAVWLRALLSCSKASTRAGTIFCHADTLHHETLLALVAQWTSIYSRMVLSLHLHLTLHHSELELVWYAASTVQYIIHKYIQHRMLTTFDLWGFLVDFWWECPPPPSEKKKKKDCEGTCTHYLI